MSSSCAIKVTAQLELFFEHIYKDIYRGDLETLERAENYYQEALRMDSAYALAYVGLADITWAKTTMEEYFEETFLDSVLILVNLALSIDDLSSEAYTLRGCYYYVIGNRDLAFKDLEKAVRLNPNNGRAYNVTAQLYASFDFVKTLEYVHKAYNIDRGPRFAFYLVNLTEKYFVAGIINKALHYNQEYLKLTGDSIRYYFNLGSMGLWMENYAEAIEYSKKAIIQGSILAKTNLAYALVRSGQPEEI